MSLTTPPLPVSALPPGKTKFLSAVPVKIVGAAFLRKVAKLAVVPEGSDRWIAMMSASGRVTPEFSAAIAGSFHFVI